MSPLLGSVRYEALPLAGTAERAAAGLPAGATVTVSCSPTHGLDATVAVAEQLSAAGLRAVPHLAARQVTDDVHLKEVASRLEAAGVDDVFVVGGDAERPAGPYDSGLALLEGLTELGVRFPHVGVPAYPEGHPRIDDATLDAALQVKQAHATYLVTQLCFDAGAILAWLAATRRAGVYLPAWIGLPGLVSRTRLVRTALRIGVGDSARYLAANRRVAGRWLTGGAVSADGLADDLDAGLRPGDRVGGMHLYAFDQLAETARWVAARAEDTA